MFTPPPTFLVVLSTFFKKQDLLATCHYWLSPMHSISFHRGQQLLCTKIEVDLLF